MWQTILIEVPLRMLLVWSRTTTDARISSVILVGTWKRKKRCQRTYKERWAWCGQVRMVKIKGTSRQYSRKKSRQEEKLPRRRRRKGGRTAIKEAHYSIGNQHQRHPIFSVFQSHHYPVARTTAFKITTSSLLFAKPGTQHLAASPVSSRRSVMCCRLSNLHDERRWRRSRWVPSAAAIVAADRRLFR